MEQRPRKGDLIWLENPIISEINKSICGKVIKWRTVIVLLLGLGLDKIDKASMMELWSLELMCILSQTLNYSSAEVGASVGSSSALKTGVRTCSVNWQGHVLQHLTIWAEPWLSPGLLTLLAAASDLNCHMLSCLSHSLSLMFRDEAPWPQLNTSWGVDMLSFGSENLPVTGEWGGVPGCSLLWWLQETQKGVPAVFCRMNAQWSHGGKTM